MSPIRFISCLFLLLFISACRQEEVPETYPSGGGSGNPMFLPIDWTGEKYLLYQAADSLSGDSSFVTYPTQDTLFFLTATSMRFRGDTMAYQVFRPAQSSNQFFFRMILTPYGHFQYGEENCTTFIPDSIHVQTGNNPWFHKLWMVRL